MGAPTATHRCRHGYAHSRYASSGFRMVVLRRAEAGREAAHAGFLALSRTEIPRLLRACAQARRRYLYGRPQTELCRSLDLRNCRGLALCLPKTHEAI